MAYVSFPEGILWKANRDGSNPVQLTGPPWYPVNPHWSPDGSQILFMADSKAYVISSVGGTPQALLPDDKGAQNDPNWSAEGRRIVFTSGGFLDPKSDLRILDLASHKVTPVPGSIGLFSPRWSPDGRFIIGLDTMSQSMKLFNVETQRWSDLR